MKLVKLKCDNCGARIEANDQLKKVTCNYCGSTFFVDDEIQRVEINKNIKYTDEARIKENETRIKELEYKYKDDKLKKVLDLFKNDNFVVVFILIFLFVVHGIVSIGTMFSLKPKEDEVVIPLDAKKYKGENYE